MIEPNAQGADATLNVLEPVIPTIYRALEVAVQEASEFFESQSEDGDVDPFLFPNLVRFYAKQQLDSGGLHAVDDDELQRDELANNGLLLRYRERRIRILKSDDGGLPAPGISRAKQNFYEQLSLLEEPVAFQNLVILWDVTDGTVDLRLVCPKHGSVNGASFHWDVAIPHPAELLPEATPVSENFEFDLPIELPNRASLDE